MSLNVRYISDVDEESEMITDQETKELVLEVVGQALDGLFTAQEMTAKIEQLTGGKIEREVS